MPQDKNHKLMTKSLATIMDEYDEGLAKLEEEIGRSRLATKEAEKAAAGARMAGLKGAEEARIAAEEAREAGLKAAQEAGRVAEEAIRVVKSELEAKVQDALAIAKDALRLVKLLSEAIADGVSAYNKRVGS